jgi:hypothetical protein
MLPIHNKQSITTIQSNTNDNNKINKENTITIIILIILIIVYINLIFGPDANNYNDTYTESFVIRKETLNEFISFNQDSLSNNEYNSNYNSSSYIWGGADKRYDDFFIQSYGNLGGGGYQKYEKEEDTGPNIPSTKFICSNTWITMRSDMNYKYLWMRNGENFWMSATATIDTPIHHKAFETLPILDCSVENGGWVLLREGDSKEYIYMVPPSSISGISSVDEWVVKTGTSNLNEAINDTSYHFLLEESGYLLNRRTMAFVNVMPEADYSIRGHSGGWNRDVAAHREYGAMLNFQNISAESVELSIIQEEKEEKEATEKDNEYIDLIAKLPTSDENRIISYGLYGKKDKYTLGAIKNAEMVSIFFPGWKCRFYVTTDVPTEIIKKLKDLGAEIEEIPSGMGYSSGMFWRFMVAADSTVDRYIIRDVDSRLNSRDRLAVEEWINSKAKIHIIRDHVNHCLVMNGGMWGGVKGALPNIKEDILDWSSRDEYTADLKFLENVVWPDIKNDHIAHDSYCCDRYPNTQPFPTRRLITYQHVGQVFDSHDRPRLSDIDGFIRGVPIPQSCRKNADWIYG